jgi:hypothetical protein
MTDKILMERLSRLGLPMMETDEQFDVNQTLAEVVKSRDSRIWEGFPVLLVNAAKDYHFEYQRVLDNLTAKREKKAFHALLLLSLALYEFYNLSFFWTKRLTDRFSDEERSHIRHLRNSIAHNDQFDFGGARFHPDRLKRMFELYFEKSAEKSRQQKEKYQELSLEYALSQLFSPKQKELFKKKLEGLPLSKTEKEYYSRAVKKKVVALANEELHSLARKSME